jgi:hypothetical protein
MHLGVALIAPRQLGVVEDQLGRQFLSSVKWCTGQSGAPPDSHCSCPMRDRLPNQAYPAVVPPGPLAHRTVWCTSWPLEQSTCRPQISRPTVGAGDLWLTGQSGAPPDSPMNYNHVALILFPRATSSPWMTHRTVRCTTGQSSDL